MLTKTSPVAEEVPTTLALVTLRVIMNKDVFFELAFGFESFSTFVASVLPCGKPTDIFVSHEAWQATESLLAYVTNMRSSPGVACGMGFQIGLGHEALSTSGTEIGKFLFMRQLMASQWGSWSVCFPAIFCVALVFNAFVLALRVCHQMTSFVEYLVTRNTLEASFNGVPSHVDFHVVLSCKDFATLRTRMSRWSHSHLHGHLSIGTGVGQLFLCSCSCGVYHRCIPRGISGIRLGWGWCCGSGHLWPAQSWHTSAVRYWPCGAISIWSKQIEANVNWFALFCEKKRGVWIYESISNTIIMAYFEYDIFQIRFYSITILILYIWSLPSQFCDKNIAFEII